MAFTTGPMALAISSLKAESNKKSQAYRQDKHIIPINSRHGLGPPTLERDVLVNLHRD